MGEWPGLAGTAQLILLRRATVAGGDADRCALARSADPFGEAAGGHCAICRTTCCPTPLL